MVIRKRVNGMAHTLNLKSKNRQNRINSPTADKMFNVVLMMAISIITIVLLYPLYFVLIASFTDPKLVGSGQILLYSKNFTLAGYQNIIKNDMIWTGYGNTIFRYVIPGTILSVLVTTMAAFSLSRRDLKGRNVIMAFYIFTMYFSGGLVPTYLLMKSLHLINNPLIIILLSAFSVYNMIIARTFFVTSIPFELQEAAMVDGCTTQRLFFSIIVPLSKPILAVLALYNAVGHWNAYFNAMIYLQDQSYYPLQLVLRSILLSGSALEKNISTVSEAAANDVSLESIGTLAKYCVIVVSTAPIIVVYPFLQKYFVKGVMIGAVKG